MLELISETAQEIPGMNWVVIGTFCISAIGLLAGLAAVYTRASLAQMQREMAVLTYRMDSIDRLVAENKAYCHDMAHRANNLVATYEGRLNMLEYRADEDERYGRSPKQKREQREREIREREMRDREGGSS